jgi:hypothetical protein
MGMGGAQNQGGQTQEEKDLAAAIAASYEGSNNN